MQIKLIQLISELQVRDPNIKVYISNIKSIRNDIISSTTDIEKLKHSLKCSKIIFNIYNKMYPEDDQVYGLLQLIENYIENPNNKNRMRIERQERTFNEYVETYNNDNDNIRYSLLEVFFFLQSAITYHINNAEYSTNAALNALEEL